MSEINLIWACEEQFAKQYFDCVLNADTQDIQAASILDDVEVPEILSIDGEEATVSIKGVLTSTRIPAIARFFGFVGTSYPEIKDALEAVSEASEVKRVRLAIDSPGGDAKGVDEVAQQVAALSKKKSVIAENQGMVASGAYWIASQANKIISTAPNNETGSIGVLIVGYDVTGLEEKIGVKRVVIVSKNAPNKGADLDTKEGIAVLQKRVNAIEEVFITRVAEGRKVDEGLVKEKFGQGGLLIAAEAQKVGMIDKVVTKISNPAQPTRLSVGEMEELFAGATAFKNFPIVDKPWNSTAAIKRVRQKTGSTEKPSASYRNAFFWFDSEEAESFGAYKLPFVDVVDGKLVAIRRGVFAANGAMSGARGGVDIPAKDKSAVQAHIDKYIKKIEKKDSKKKGKSMATLKELVLENEGLQAEVDTLKSESFEAGKAEVRAEVEGIIPFIKADYPAVIKDMIPEVLEGKTSLAELKGAVAYHDSTKEAAAAAAAEEETEEAGDTAAEQPPVLSEDGSINTEDDFNAAVDELKTVQGIGKE